METDKRKQTIKFYVAVTVLVLILIIIAIILVFLGATLLIFKQNKKDHDIPNEQS